MALRRAPYPLFAAVVLMSLASPVAGQGTSGPSVSNNAVGYIDPAVPGDVFRLRFDTAYNNRRPTRAEVFYARGAPFGPGLPLPEPSVDYQDLFAYLEVAPAPRFSLFVDIPERFLNPEVNANSGGLGDVNAGFKYAFVHGDDLVATLQLRTFAPTGDADRGLGTRHVSLEPALLVYKPLGERLAFDGELRYWVPVGGTDFAGDVIRYGLGLQYDLFRTRHVLFTPVVEFVGWTVLDGKESIVHPSGLSEVKDASGDTIVNAKVGLRTRLGCWGDVYTGYGRPLTGDRWYENVFRVEFRLLY